VLCFVPVCFVLVCSVLLCCVAVFYFFIVFNSV